MSTIYRGNDLVLGKDRDGRPLVLTELARRLHVWMPGTTGMGKSRALVSMLWQDIQAWKRSRHGVLLIDPDGETYDQVLRLIATYPGASRLPLVLIDLRRSDQVIGYNLLRRRAEEDPAVTALNLLEAITFAYGEVEVMAKPTLYRTAVTILRALIEADMSLAHAPLVLSPERADLRAELERCITDPIALANLSRINQKSVTDKSGRLFDEETLAFANRMFGPLSNQLLRHMFGQTEVSFDFDSALEQGAIVLVSLATKDNQVSETDARLVGSLLLSDLWQAARRRGKKGGGQLPGFYVYIDEFQTLLTPTIAANLSRARGYGLHFTLANQLVSQLEDNAGRFGKAVYHAVLGNTGTKIVFRASTDEADLRPLTRAVFLGEVDIGKVKDEFTSFQVVDHEEVRERMHGGSSAETDAHATGSVRSHSRTEGGASGSQHGSGVGTGVGASSPLDDPTGMAGATSEISVESFYGAFSESENHSDTEGESESDTHTRSKTAGESWQDSVRMRPIIKERVSSRTYESVENQLFAFDQRIASLGKREAIVKCADAKAPVTITTLDMPESKVSDRLVERLRELALDALPFAMPMAVAKENLAALDAAPAPVPEPEPEPEPAFVKRRRAPRAKKPEANHGA